jgi:hypothetical protein
VSAPEATGEKSGTKVAKGLSEFFAKVLDQLVLSSWLPAAAVVLGGVYVLALRQELDHPTSCTDDCSWASGLVGGAARLADLSVGGAVVLFVLIIVTTLLSQAFSFEAIRFLEGYWGANRVTRRWGRWGTTFHTKRQARLQVRQAALQTALVDSAFRSIRSENSARSARGEPPLLAPIVLDWLLATLEKRAPLEALSEAEFKTATAFRWRTFAETEPRLEKVIVDNRLAVYPKEGWLMPTLLGNIVRRHELQMKVERVESFVQDHFDELPASLQHTHDEVKTRLELYASLVFLLPALALFAVVVLLPNAWYVVGACGVLFAFTVVAHRAAVASARAYGSVLVSVADAVRGRVRV